MTYVGKLARYIAQQRDPRKTEEPKYVTAIPAGQYTVSEGLTELIYRAGKLVSVTDKTMYLIIEEKNTGVVCLFDNYITFFNKDAIKII